MAALDPAIHAFLKQEVDARDKRGHDEPMVGPTIVASSLRFTMPSAG
jgi:hypothetical protein